MEPTKTEKHMKEFDAIIIGTGQAGPALAARFAKEGKSTAIVERKRFGGTCVNNGCVPTKTLVASARTAHVARRAAEYGVTVEGKISVDMKAVKARKDKIVNESTRGVETWLRSTKNLTVYEGHAMFESSNAVRVGEDELKADKIFINVGGRASIPEGFAGVKHLTNSTIMDVDYVPEHLSLIHI